MITDLDHFGIGHKYNFLNTQHMSKNSQHVFLYTQDGKDLNGICWQLLPFNAHEAIFHDIWPWTMRQMTKFNGNISYVLSNEL